MEGIILGYMKAGRNHHGHLRDCQIQTPTSLHSGFVRAQRNHVSTRAFLHVLQQYTHVGIHIITIYFKGSNQNPPATFI